MELKLIGNKEKMLQKQLKRRNKEIRKPIKQEL